MISIKTLDTLTPVEWQACYRANYGAGGYMRYTLMEHKGNSKAIAIMIWNGSNDTFKNLLGWCLLTPVSTRGNAATTYYMFKNAKYTAQFWVKSPYRKQGWGKVLMQEAKKFDERPHCFPHDETSGNFFSNFNIRSEANDRMWLVKKPKVA